MNLSKIKTLIAAPEDGKDAASAVFTPPILWVESDDDGWSIGDQHFNIDAGVVVDGINVGFNTLIIVSSPTGVSASLVANTGVVAVTVYDGTDPAEYEGEIKIRMTGTASGETYTVVKSVPVIAKKKGSKGEDGVSYDIIPSVAFVRKDHSGSILTGVIGVSAYKTEGSERTQCTLGTSASDHYWAQYSIDGGNWTDCSLIEVGNGYVYGVPASAVATVTTGIAFRLLYGTTALHSVVKEIPALQVVQDGQPGQRGPSRFYYYDGYFDSTKEYRASDNQAPYVAFDWDDVAIVNGQSTRVTRTSYYMLVADTNKPESTYIAPRTAAASGVWELMESSFKWLIAEAFFTAFAKLGSAVFIGDWMISQYGTRNGIESTDYRYFNVSTPMGASSNDFVPYLAIDLMHGKVYMNDADVRGTVRAVNLYHNVQVLSYAQFGDVKIVIQADIIIVQSGGWDASPDQTRPANSVIVPDPDKSEGKLVEIVNRAYDRHPTLRCLDDTVGYFVNINGVQSASQYWDLFGIKRLRMVSEGSLWYIIEIVT